MTINPLFSQTFSEVKKPNATNNPWSIETLLRTNNNGGVNWNTPSLRARYFFNDSWNLRFQLGLGDGTGRPISEHHEYNEFIDGSGDIGTRTVKRSNLNLQLGTEYHFLGTKKLDPYTSLSINFGFGKEKEVRWLTIYVAEQNETVENSFKLYFPGSIKKLNQELSRLPLFTEQEAKQSANKSKHAEL
jgi:hypothetical protein